MQDEAGMGLQPTFNRGRFVRGGVVEHDVAVQVRRYFSVDLFEKPQEFLTAVTGVQGADDFAGAEV